MMQNGTILPLNLTTTIDDWAHSPGDCHLGLLDGPAGFMKSAIACMVAEWWDHSNFLAGTFFFFQNSGDQSKVVWLVSTHVPLHSIDNPSLLNQPIKHQFQKLIVDPIVALPKQSHHQMIIIGALDECEDHEPIQQLITFTASVDYFKFPVNFLFTSRREEHIHKIFEFPSVNYMPYHLSLSNTTFNVHGDIKHFLWSQFSIIYQQNL